MSGFKRAQSKVFWGQMQAQDLASCSAEATAVISSPRRNVALHQHDDFEEDDVPAESDTTSTDPDNTTVIHVEIDDSPAARSVASEERSTESASAEGPSRSLSPGSRGQRSQDSGFSDSGRSDSSGDGILRPHQQNAGEEPRRRRKRRSRSQPREPGPVHTSTPKQQQPERSLSLHRPDLMKHVTKQLDFSLNSTRSQRRSGSATECLDDFLFSDEPPSIQSHSQNSCRSGCEYTSRSWRRILRAAGGRDSTLYWLHHLVIDGIEDECMATLQSKSLPRRRHRDDEPDGRDLRLLTASATTAAKKVMDKAGRFDRRYQRVLDSISNSKNGVLNEEMLQLIEDEATEILVKFGCTLPRRIVNQDSVRNIVLQLARLKNNVDRALDRRLDFYIEKVVRGLEEAPRENGSTARGALAALTALGLAGPRAGASVARCGGIRALLTSLVSSQRLTSELRSGTLRALASVCCCLEAVEQFVAEGGPEILVDVLGSAKNNGSPETERSEAAALLVQVSAPWMDRVGLPYLEPFARPLVESLTDLAEVTTCKQTLLLAAAALNQLAHSSRCVGPIVACDSVKRLLRCVKRSGGGNVWLIEQVASLIGQLARVPQARAYLAASRASVALVCFLRMQPPGPIEDEYRRLCVTVSEALTRLCVEPEIAKQVVAVGGSDWCLPRAQNGSAAVPVEEEGLHSTKSLRAARRIAAEQIDIARVNERSPY
ncbi:hypothetical protein QAD02_012116 [Eretmocerus hayati]|uniref:Uncharacterized protein n=1 Tax=Eretmocerus hayati TaxID=131215 RepID=A0ACC2NYG1_9HYME|nr:hypothetical protein QAD02_012116 [Eretmocerus hayati]